MQIKKCCLLPEFNSKKIKIFIIAGELSGDNLGEGLIKELKKVIRNLEIYGVGGEKMITQGLKPIFEKKPELYIYPFVDAEYDHLVSNSPQSYLYSVPNPVEKFSVN